MKVTALGSESRSGRKLRAERVDWTDVAPFREADYERQHDRACEGAPRVWTKLEAREERVLAIRRKVQEVAPLHERGGKGGTTGAHGCARLGGPEGRRRCNNDRLGPVQG